MINYQAVGLFISKLRKAKGLTQMEFAGYLNVTHQAVSKWENGLTLPDTETLFAISKQFNVKVDDILYGNFEKFSDKIESEDETKNIEIMFDFGLGIVPYLNIMKDGNFLEKVKEMRQRLELQIGKVIPLIRIMDNIELKNLQFRISINGKVFINNNLEIVPEEARFEEMLSFLEYVIKSNTDMF